MEPVLNCVYCGQSVSDGRTVCNSCFFKQASGEKLTPYKKSQENVKPVVDTFKSDSDIDDFKEIRRKLDNTNTLEVPKSKRIGNYIIDIMAFYFLSFALGIFSGLMGGASGAGFLYVSVYLIFFLYYFVMELTIGKTIGKALTKTRVVMITGEKPNAGAIFIRTVCRFIPFEPFSFLGASNSGWHDKFSKTMVIEDKIQ